MVLTDVLPLAFVETDDKGVIFLPLAQEAFAGLLLPGDGWTPLLPNDRVLVRRGSEMTLAVERGDQKLLWAANDQEQLPIGELRNFDAVSAWISKFAEFHGLRVETLACLTFTWVYIIRERPAGVAPS